MLIVIILGSFPISIIGQQDVPEESIGVTEGQIFTYQITNILNFEDIPFFVGENNQGITGELGDVIRLEIISTELTEKSEIEIELRSKDESVQYFNKMDTFDLIVFADWDYWRNLVKGYNIVFQETDDTFEFQIAFLDDGLVYYLVTTYDKTNGVFLYQLIYITPENDFDNPIALVEISQGNPLPQPDKSKIDASLTDFYQFEITQLIGYEDTPLLNGTDGELYAESGDVIEILVVGDELTSNREIFLAAKNDNTTIIYPNRMDFLNSVYEISFFVFTDWAYLGELTDVFSANLTDHHQISYEITDQLFIYKEEFWNESEVFYDIELQYNISTGAMVYQGFIFENLTSSEISIVEINQLKPVQVDTTTLLINENQDFSFVVEQYESSEPRPILSTLGGNIWLFEGDIFDIILDETRHQLNEAEVRLHSLDQTFSFTNSLTSLGSFIIYPDWDYWGEYLDFLTSFTDNVTSVSYTQDEILFSVNITILDNVTDYEYQISYEKANGVLNQLSVNSEIIQEDNSTTSFNLEINRYTGPKPFGNITETNLSYTLDTFTPSETIDESDTLGITLLSSIIGLIIINFIRKKRNISKL